MTSRTQWIWQIVSERAWWVEGFGEAVLSVYAKGLTVGGIRAHLAGICDVGVSRDLISRARDKVTEELEAWRARPLGRVCAVLVIDAVVLRICDGVVADRVVCIAVGISVEGERDVLGMWVGSGGEGAKSWLAWLAELKNRGVGDVLIACCDGLKGLPESISGIWPPADFQLCVVHMVRNGLKYASARHWSQFARELRQVCTAVTADAAEQRFAGFEEVWGAGYPALIALWRRSWEHLVMFLRFPPEIRKIVCTTNMIESLDSRFRQATRCRGHFPNEEAALKVLYLVIRDRPRRPSRRSPTGRTHDWKEAVNTLAGCYGDRVTDSQ